MTNGARVPGGRVRIITEGYSSGEGYSAPTTSPHGKYVGEATDQGTGKPIATAAYWDGLWDHGPDDGENAPFGPPPPDPNSKEYGAFLVLDDVILDGAGEYQTFYKTA